MTTRAERTEVALRLRAEGLTGKEIAARLGVSRSYAADLYNDPTGEKGRARKARNCGTCERCGGPTSGSNGRKAAPRICGDCFDYGTHNRAVAQRRRGTGSSGSAVLALFADQGEASFSELTRRVFPHSPSQTGPSLARLMRYGLIVRVGRGRYKLAEKVAA